VLLLRWSRGNPSRDVRAFRARIILRAAAGLEDLEIGRQLGMSRLTAARWRRRFLTARLRGIQPSRVRIPRGGGIPDPRVQEILRASTLGARFGPRRVSTRSLARRFDVSHTTVRRLWNEFGVRPASIEALPIRPDPVLPLEPCDVVGLYLHSPDFACALLLAPRAPGALDRPASGTDHPAQDLSRRWAREVLTFPSGTGSALPPVTPSPAPRLREFLRFLGEVERATGRGRSLRIVATLPGLSAERDLRSWQTRRPNFRLDLSETRGTWRSRVEQDLDRSGRRGPSRRGSHGRSETTRAIGLFLSTYSDTSGPFSWVASPREVGTNDAGSRLRYDLSVTGHHGFKKPSAVVAPMRTPPPPDPRAREMARVVLEKCLHVRSGEHVVVESWSETLDYANAFVLETLRLGARPLLLYQDEPTYWAAVAENRPSSLGRVGDHLRAAIARSDALVTFFGPSDRERFHALPTSTIFRLSEYRDSLYAAAAKARTRAVQIALGRASPASAQMYGVDLADWRTELVDGTTVDPEVLHRRAGRVARALHHGRVLEVSHPNGTHLELGLRHRRPRVSDGLVPRAKPKGDWNLVQLPAGVVSVALDERVADGTLLSNVRNSVGVFDTVGEVEGGRWTFSDGRLARYTYTRGQDVFSQSYARGGHGKDRVGILSVGLNDRISMAPLLLDQEAGALTLQIGRNDTAGGTNHVNWWAWLILRGADLRVDGKALVKEGKLVE
jgi:leucyl aminopeptidase (aminopeptidase T)